MKIRAINKKGGQRFTVLSNLINDIDEGGSNQDFHGSRIDKVEPSKNGKFYNKRSKRKGKKAMGQDSKIGFELGVNHGLDQLALNKDKSQSNVPNNEERASIMQS